MTYRNDKQVSGEAGAAARRPMSATALLLLLNLAAFALQALLGNSPRFAELLPLSVDGLRHGHVWQLITYQFLHGGWIHLAMNCWGIFLIGREVERALGARRFWILYLMSGVIGGVFQVAAAITWSAHFGTVVVGASAGLFGLIAAFASMYPRDQIMLILPPVTLEAQTLLTLSGALAVVGMLFPMVLAPLGLGPNVAHAAHLGGMIGGLVYVRWLRHRWGRWPGELIPAQNAR